jgi:hypothetical protein
VRDSFGSQLFETGEFTVLNASRPVTINETEDFEYADTVEYEGGFVMTGTIRVVDQGITTTNPATLLHLVGRSEHSSKFQTCGFWN